MKILGPLSVVLLFSVWIACQPATAGEWWWAAESSQTQRSQSPAKKPFNPLAPIDAGVKGIDRGLKKLGSDTKRFFSKTGDALRWKRPGEQQPTSPHLPWIQPARPQTQSEEKSSWLGSLSTEKRPGRRVPWTTSSVPVASIRSYSQRTPLMTRRSIRVTGFPLLAAFLTVAGILVVSGGCTAAIGKGGPGLLRSETETAAFREAVERDKGIPTAAQAGVAPCE